MNLLFVFMILIFSVNAHCGNSHGMERRSARIVPYEEPIPAEETVVNQAEASQGVIREDQEQDGYWNDMIDFDVADTPTAATMNTRMLIVVEAPSPPNNEPIEILETPLRVVSAEVLDRSLPMVRTPTHRIRMLTRRAPREAEVEHEEGRRRFTFARHANRVDAPPTHFVQYDEVPRGDEVNMSRFTIQPIQPPVRRSLEMEFNNAASQ